MGLEGIEDYTVKKYLHIVDVSSNKTATIEESGIVSEYGSHTLIEAKTDTDTGTVLFSKWYTPQGLEKIGWRIVIEPQGS